MKVAKDGKTYPVVIVGSPNVNSGYKLVNNPQYPNIAQDYERCFRTLESLKCDIFLGAHGEYYDLTAKYPKLAFIDPPGYLNYVAERKSAFETELRKQQGQ